MPGRISASLCPCSQQVIRVQAPRPQCPAVGALSRDIERRYIARDSGSRVCRIHGRDGVAERWQMRMIGEIERGDRKHLRCQEKHV
jgi:hypothetical protein